MAELHVITAINKAYAYLLGEWETAEQHAEGAEGVKAILQAWQDIETKKKTIRETLDHLEAVARIFKPSWDPGVIDPQVRRPDKRKHGTVSRVALKILRQENRPLRLRELVNLTAEALELEVIDERHRQQIQGSLYGVIKRRLGKTIFKDDGVPARYAPYPLGQEPLSSDGVANSHASALTSARARRRQVA